jgi:pimeloyl-ACP methyl ester carboxylesterase
MPVRMLREDEVAIAPPSLLLLMLEGRAFGEYASLLLSRPFMGSLPRGDGHPVLVIPGFGGSDAGTRPLRKVLRRLGYDVHGWGQGRNLGMRTQIRERLRLRLHEVNESHQRKVSLIGWSLGGVFVREIARHAPERVRRVITLGSPINGHPQSNNVDALYRWFNGKTQKVDWEGFQRRREPPSVPCTAIYSKTDGVVAWRCCLEEEAPNTENVEVQASHLSFPPLARSLRWPKPTCSRASSRKSPAFRRWCAHC